MVSSSSHRYYNRYFLQNKRAIIRQYHTTEVVQTAYTQLQSIVVHTHVILSCCVTSSQRKQTNGWRWRPGVFILRSKGNHHLKETCSLSARTRLVMCDVPHALLYRVCFKALSCFARSDWLSANGNQPIQILKNKYCSFGTQQEHNNTNMHHKPSKQLGGVHIGGRL